MRPSGKVVDDGHVAFDPQQTKFSLVYRGTALIRNRPPLGPCSRPMPGALWCSQRGGRFLMGEVPL